MLPAVSPSHLTIVEKITRLWRERRLKLGFFLIVVVVALFSFALGYMAARDSVRTPIIIESFQPAP